MISRLRWTGSERIRSASLGASPSTIVVVGLVGIERWKMRGQKPLRRMARLRWRVQMEIISTIMRNLNVRKARTRIISRKGIRQEIVTVRKMRVLESRIRNKGGKAVTIML